MPFTYTRTIHFSDTDAAGVVYFANILSICHEAYEESLGTSGIKLKAFFTNSDVALPIVHASVDFFRPLFCGDQVIISLMPQKIGVDKFEINYELFLADILIAKAITRHVCIDASSRSKQELSPEIIQWLNSYRKETEEVERRKAREVI
ncbi:acyl-CoA thioesterase [Anabaena subtropica]|uniref:1,4-dihydroxy-2-naphthoyl-CoA hydrolase n=1 Tax=Anabaena subtropica FACHB-260 TaxID=2692884 RepID=A0ABR8CJE2_9NOST|nr:thioesterase family protein [Anabaena subtropica]MBD2343270.1 acyl-CoA thioesterase [Anabaena subtropica FACHB-260]